MHEFLIPDCIIIVLLNIRRLNIINECKMSVNQRLNVFKTI